MTGAILLLPLCLNEVDRNNSAFNVHVPLILPITANQIDNFPPAPIRFSVKWLIIQNSEAFDRSTIY